jgi:hypothetical protein
MSILLLADYSALATEVGLDVAGETGEAVVIIRDAEHFQRVLNHYMGRLHISSVLVLGTSELLSSQWEAFLQRHHFYQMGLPIRWMTHLH